VNVQCDKVIRSVEYLCIGAESPEQFDVVVTIFCLEYSCENLHDYQRAVRGAVQLIKPGGYLIYGGIMNASDYGFAGRRFSCHYLIKQELIDTLKVGGLYPQMAFFKLTSNSAGQLDEH
jgi:2-polyprenyl-3-methyl-5-hydroxy-6-metoxy-1,4-benzoquinol methylase